jgi:hypothetical protein
METSLEHPSALLLERYLQGELSPAQAEPLRDHMRGCAACRAHVLAMEQRDEALRQHALPGWLQEAAARQEDAAPRPAQAPSPPRAPARRWAWRSALAGAAAMAVALLLLWRFTSGPAAPTDTLRLKSGGFGFAAWLKRGDLIHPLASGDTVHPGDRIGFKIYPERPGHLMIAGRDDAGQVYRCYPERGEASPVPGRAEDGSPLEIDQAIELDHTLGHERLVAVLCPTPFGWDSLRAALQEEAPEHDRLPELLPGCAQREITVNKRAAP